MSRLQHTILANEHVADHVSDQYAPVSTKLFLKPFLDMGWSSKNSRPIFNKTGKISKEVVTLVHTDYFTEHGPIELKVVNSYDARSSLKIYVGIHRQVCSNGLIMMVEGEQFRFIHRGTAIYEKLENSYEKIIAYIDTVRLRIKKLQATSLSQDALNDVMTNIAKRVFEKDSRLTKVEVTNINNLTRRNLNRVRREADRQNDAFTQLNRLQENITRRGALSATIKVIDKETNQVTFDTVSKRSTENKVSDIRMNQIITEEFLKAVA